MKGVIIHWTAGAHKANATDRKAYHVLIEGDGTVVQGVPIERNAAPLKDGYAAHTLNANTDRIGVSMCAMGGAVESPFNPGKWPITEVQFEQACREVAKLCATYNIPVTPTTVLTHAEVQPNLGIAQRGKWDITRYANLVGAAAVGNHMRDRVRHYLTGEPVPEGAQGLVVTSGSRLQFRTGPGTQYAATGEGLPNGTPFTVLAIYPEWLHVRTPAGYEGFISRQFTRMVDGPAPQEPTTPAPVCQKLTAAIDLINSALEDL